MSHPIGIESLVATSKYVPYRLMAQIKGVRYGVNDRGDVGLSFGAYIAEGVGAPQFLHAPVASAVLLMYQVGDVSRLEGKTCWVVLDNGRCVFESPCLI